MTRARRLRHLRGQRELGERLEADELRGFVAQREDLLDQRAVVPAAGVRPLIRRARDPGLVVLLAQRRRFGVRRARSGKSADRAAGTSLRQPRSAASARRAIEHELRQARERGAVGLAMLERVRRVHDVLLELRLLRGELLHDLAEALPRCSRQRDAAEPKVAQRVGDELPLDGLAPARRARCSVLKWRYSVSFCPSSVPNSATSGRQRLNASRSGGLDTHGVQVRDRAPNAVDLGVDVLEARAASRDRAWPRSRRRRARAAARRAARARRARRARA